MKSAGHGGVGHLLTENTATCTRASVLKAVTPAVDSRMRSRRASSAADNSELAGGRAVGSNTRRSVTAPVSEQTSATQSELTALKEDDRGGGERTNAMRRPSALQTMFLGAPVGVGLSTLWNKGREGGGRVAPSLKLPA